MADRNPIVRAVIEEEYVEGFADRLRALVAQGHDVNGSDSFEQFTPLTAAASRGDLRVFHAVLALDPRRDVADARGKTALSEAAEKHDYSANHGFYDDAAAYGAICRLLLGT